MLVLTTGASPFRFSFLNGHEPKAWNSSCNASIRELVACNFDLYSAAAAAASAGGAQLLLFPEGYGLGTESSKSSFFEPLVSEVGSVQCATSNASSSPQQHSLSCLAREKKLALSAKVFVQLPNGTLCIVSVVFNSTGATVAQYTKHHLFETVRKTFAAGPFVPGNVLTVRRRASFVAAHLLRGPLPDSAQ